MCFSCNRKIKIRCDIINRRTNKPISFQSKQIDELRKKYFIFQCWFQKISGGRHNITKQMFRQNLGVLGLRVSLRSDRLFNSFDLDDDGYINFSDFVEYMDIIKSGTQQDKSYISFRMIRTDNKKKYFNRKDFEQFMNDFLFTWSTLTDCQLSLQILNRNKVYIQQVFQKIKQKKKNNEEKIYLEDYTQYIYKDQEFMQAFDFITQRVAGIFTNRATQKQKKLEKGFQQIESQLKQVYKSICLRKTNEFSDVGTQSSLNFAPIFKKFKFPSRFDDEFSRSYKKSILSSEQGELSRSQKRTEINLNKNYRVPQIQSQQKMVIIDSLKNKFDQLLNKVHQIRNELDQQKMKQKQSIFQKQKRNNTVANVHKNLKEGQMIYIGDENWNLVLNMMIGIQMAVKTVKSYQNQEMIYQEPKDFKLKYYFQLIPRRFGGDKKMLSTIYKFTDYAPNTFNHIRRIFGINNDEYLKSIGTQKLLASLLLLGQVSSMAQLTSQGKSGSFFYYTADGKYMLKTIHFRQYCYLKQILEDYYYYLSKNKDSLITKFFGLHKLAERTQSGQVQKKHYFVIMANVFNTVQKISERYDIKGSRYGRTNLDKDEKATKKDNDFLKREQICIQSDQKQQILEIIRKDALFFEQHNIIDYSLLIGIIKTQINKMPLIIQSEVIQSSLNAKIYKSKTVNEKYVFGIIDILTLYDSRKKLQYYFKKTIYGNQISAVPPSEYSDRFFAFISKQIFK